MSLAETTSITWTPEAQEIMNLRADKVALQDKIQRLKEELATLIRCHCGRTSCCWCGIGNLREKVRSIIERHN